jgi:hypothetical protein
VIEHSLKRCGGWVSVFAFHLKVKKASSRRFACTGSYQKKSGQHRAPGKKRQHPFGSQRSRLQLFGHCADKLFHSMRKKWQVIFLTAQRSFWRFSRFHGSLKGHFCFFGGQEHTGISIACTQLRNVWKRSPAGRKSLSK